MTSMKKLLADGLPHVDQRWAESAIVELRLRDADGVTIGAALAEVESHMAESDADIRDEFGEPAAYAASLSLPKNVTQPKIDALLTVARSLTVGFGAFLLTSGLLDLRDGETNLPLSVVVAFVLAVGCVCAALAVGNRFLRWVIEHPLIAAPGVILLGIAMVVASLALPKPEISAPAWVTITIGGSLLLIGLLWVRANRKRDPSAEITLPNA